MKKHVNRNRSFDRLSYALYDKKAREAMIKYLTDNNFTDIVSKEDYNFDIYAKKNKEHFFEVEVKTQWRDKWNSSWKEIRIPERKQRLINIWREKYPQHDFKFVVFNNDLKQAWFIDAEVVDKASVGTIQNSRFTNAPHLKEPFFHIPVGDANLVQIEKEES
jgi:hypothetical protein|tara:strand:+ start:42 stop:527 length:486 start_codon:yes stop_codon:yes gene_type:complete